MFLGSGPYNRGHVKLMDVVQAVPGKTATAFPDCLPSRFSTLMEIGQQNRLVGQIEYVLYLTQLCQFQTPKTSHRKFDAEIQGMMTMPNNRELI